MQGEYDLAGYRTTTKTLTGRGPKRTKASVSRQVERASADKGAVELKDGSREKRATPAAKPPRETYLIPHGCGFDSETATMSAWRAWI